MRTLGQPLHNSCWPMHSHWLTRALPTCTRTGLQASETFLQRMMALYVASHYKNTPNDLM